MAVSDPIYQPYQETAGDIDDKSTRGKGGIKLPANRQSCEVAADAADAAAEEYDQDGFHLFLIVQEFFQIHQPIAIDADNADGSSIAFIAIRIRVGSHRIIDRLDIDGQDIRVLILFPFLMGHAIIVFFPFGEQELVGGIRVKVEFGFIVVAVEGGPDELAAGILRVFRLLIRMDVVTSGQQKNGRQK
jgi:hypothetical protein